MSSSSSSSSSWVVAVVLVGSGIAGCQLLLPSDDDDTTATSNVGGAASSTSRDASSSSKSTGSMKGSSSAETTGSETTQSSASSSSSGGVSVSSGMSSSSGPLACQPGNAACAGGFASDMPTNCPVTVACGGDTDCSEYCSAMKSMCLTAYASDASCCLACDLARKSKTEPAECCHVTKLNELASGMVAGDSCTIAGAFGSTSNVVGGGCGTQQANVCGMYGKLCSAALSNCQQSQCLTYLSGEESLMIYAQNTNPTHKLSHVMDLVLSGNSACANLVDLFCPIPAAVSSSSTGP